MFKDVVYYRNTDFRQKANVLTKRPSKWTLWTSKWTLLNVFSDPQDETTSTKEWAEKAGLEINAGKTKTMRMNVKVDRHVKNDGKDLEDVPDFTYLRSKVTRKGGACDDIKSRLQKARNAFLALNQVWKSSIYSVMTKVKIFNSNVKSVLIYGSECWRIMIGDIRKCEAFQNR